MMMSCFIGYLRSLWRGRPGRVPVDECELDASAQTVQHELACKNAAGTATPPGSYLRRRQRHCRLLRLDVDTRPAGDNDAETFVCDGIANHLDVRRVILRERVAEVKVLYAEAAQDLEKGLAGRVGVLCAGHRGGSVVEDQ